VCGYSGGINDNGTCRRDPGLGPDPSPIGGSYGPFPAPRKPSGPLPPNVGNCVKKCWKDIGNSEKWWECMGICLSDSAIDNNCAAIVCLAFPELCTTDPDPCKMKSKSTSICQDCAEITYYCCLMKSRKSKDIGKCYNQAVKDHINCTPDCGTS